MSNVTYGDPSNIDVFEESYSVGGKNEIFCKEDYAEELAKIYEEHGGLDFSSNTQHLNVGDTITGKIATISKYDVGIDVNSKELVYISIDKEKTTPDHYTIGEEVTAVIIDKSGFIRVSVVEYQRKTLHEEMKSYRDRKVYDAYVVELSDSGYTLDINGLKVFMPGSMGGANVLLDFEELVGKTIKVVPVKNDNRTSKFKDQVIVSHKEYLKTVVLPTEVEKLDVGAVYTGKVTGIGKNRDNKKYGIFIEFNDYSNVLTGLIHMDDMDDGLKELFNGDKVQPGVEIDFYLKEIVNNERLILSRFPVDNTVKNKKKIQIGDEIQAKVTKKVTYGAFVSLGFKDKSGLIHVNNLNGYKLRDIKENEVYNVEVIDIQKGEKYDLKLI